LRKSYQSLTMLGASLFLLAAAGLTPACAAPSASVAPANAQPPTPAPTAVLALMEKAANWQLAHPTDYPADDWTEAVGDAGFMALAGVSGNTTYRDAMVAMGHKNRWRLGPSLYHADDQAVGQTYAELYQELRDPAMIAPMRTQFDGIIQEPRDGTLDFLVPGVLMRWSWCDSLFMGPPAWARLSAVTGDPRYLEFAITRWWRTSDYLYDKEEHLFFRDSRYFGQREANGKKVFWGRGNGWVIGGLARMLQYVPSNHPSRARFEQQYREMAERVLGLQQPDGLWRASLLDPDSYPAMETSGSGLYTYALAWGLNQGLLPKDRYGGAVRRAWRALASHVTAEGKLTHVQPIGADPRRFDPQSTDVFAVGALLMAGSEVYRMGLEEAAKPRVVTVANAGGAYRLEESVEAPVADVVVLDALTSRVLPSQAVGKGVLFQADLAPGETRRYLLFPRSALPAVPAVVPRAHARFVPERMDDFAWENDRVAHRVYGPAIMTDPREMLVSSGIDVWSKSVHGLVQDAWYRRGDYHVDKGEGLDFYHVGKTRGCGGLGVYDGKVLYTSKNFAGWKILADGPLRTEFELRFDGWDAAGRKVAETRRVSLDAGSHFSRVESRFSSPKPGPLPIAVGIVQREGKGSYADGAPGWMSYWEPPQGPDGSYGSNGCAVIVPDATAYTSGDGNYLATASATPGKPFVYYLGAAWSKGGEFADAAAWEAHVRATAARLASPVQVQVSR
jgi:rhamnogalacturonyl hydrolase YesR